ncbi:MAG: carbohydrate ABC transporter permease [Alkalibacterium gilvum]|uniref:ABC-type sugar transport system, permease component n=1 Tax=Alkalibacterium gilvum TaxID=1130080 RepID=A0A1H6RD57_9LACT|nr:MULTISPECIES: sugar ABC transporter permease [Carnobacteriaceae]MDN6194749.1 sugar ABC transporter permease [Alkalibacterium sp.]MDN6728633.1 sugar ABC transporter permease [Alkalibacterium sp.]GEQ33742.1 sugar ABC transporter permease protein [Marinilactibacillus psychrotolerans]SEI53673.1 ABC-type sugar transport system, permease component [Alkalibacterium gilvum]
MIKKIMKNPENKGYLFILPWLIGFVTLTIYPILYSFYLSFFDVTITTEGIQTESVGIENYQSAMTSDIEFINRLIEYVREILISVPLIVIISLLIALLLNQNIRFKGVFRTIFFLPVIISSGPVLDKLIGLDIATLNMVETNALYEMIAGMDNILASSFVYIIDNLIILLWFSGVQILIFNSALQKVDKKIYEAASIDGASSWESFWKITLPSLFPMIMVNIVYTTVMYSVSSLSTIVGHIQSNMFQLETGFGYASSLSWIYFILIVLVLITFTGIIGLFNRKYK